MSNTELKEMEIKTIEDAQTLHNFILTALDCSSWTPLHIDDFVLIEHYVKMPKFQVLGNEDSERLEDIAYGDEQSNLEWLDYYDWEAGCPYIDKKTQKTEISYDREEIEDMCLSDIDNARDYLKDIQDAVCEAFAELVRYAIADKVIKEEDDKLQYYNSWQWEEDAYNRKKAYIKEISDKLLELM